MHWTHNNLGEVEEYKPPLCFTDKETEAVRRKGLPQGCQPFPFNTVLEWDLCVHLSLHPPVSICLGFPIRLSHVSKSVQLLPHLMTCYVWGE